MKEKDLEIEQFKKKSKYAMDCQIWKDLSYEEFEIFTHFITYDRSAVFKIIFHKGYKNYTETETKEIWTIIQKLQNKNLIYFIKDDEKHILEILLPDKIDEIPMEITFYKKEIEHLIALLDDKDEKIKEISNTTDKNALEMIRNLSAENALLKIEIEKLKQEKKNEAIPLAVLDIK